MIVIIMMINLNIIIYVIKLVQMELIFLQKMSIYVKRNVVIIYHMKIFKLMNALKNVVLMKFSSLRFV